MADVKKLSGSTASLYWDIIQYLYVDPSLQRPLYKEMVDLVS